MEKISEMVIAQGLNMDSFKKFIESRKDQVTTRWGYFDMYCRNTLHHIGLFDDIIVVIAEDSQYEQGSGGIGHTIYMYACRSDMTQRWSSDDRISYRDQYDQSKDRVGPIPKKFVGIRLCGNTQILMVTTLMPNGALRKFRLVARHPMIHEIKRVRG